MFQSYLAIIVSSMVSPVLTRMARAHHLDNLVGLETKDQVVILSEPYYVLLNYCVLLNSICKHSCFQGVSAIFTDLLEWMSISLLRTMAKWAVVMAIAEILQLL